MESPPWALSGGTATYPAEQTRRAMFAWAARTAANSPGIIAGGLLSPTDMQLSAASSGLVVNISVGECLIGGTEGGVQGGYYARNASTSSVTLATANATNPRIDAVVGMVGDAGYTLPSGSTSGQVTLVGVTGTPTSGATLSNLSGAPAVPASSLLLGYVLVPAAATSLTSADIANVATVVWQQTLPEPLVLTSSASVSIPAGAGHMKVTLVGGGAGGTGTVGNAAGSGGCAGQFLQAFVSLAGVSGLSATIGAGGAGGVKTTGTAGGNTTLTGTGLTTLTAEGGSAQSSGGLVGMYVNNLDALTNTVGSAGVGLGSAGGGPGGAGGGVHAGFAGGAGGGGAGGNGVASGSGTAGAAATTYGSGGGGGGGSDTTPGDGSTGGNGYQGVAIFEWCP